VVFSGDREAHICPWGKTQMVRSKDNGQTWTTPVTINNTPLDDRDAGIIETRNGTLVVSWFTSLMFTGKHMYRRHREKIPRETIDYWMDDPQTLGGWIRRSEDNGETWGEPIGKLVSSPHGPIELLDGRLLYVGVGGPLVEFQDDRGAYKSLAVMVLESQDDGRTWQKISTVPRTLREISEVGVVETAQGRLIAMFRYEPSNENERYLQQSESNDGGRTWSALHPTPMWGYPPHLIRLHNNWLLVSYGHRRKPFGQRACVSRDNGITWDVENEIEFSRAPKPSEDPHLWSGHRKGYDLGYPTSVQLDDRTIFTVYYQIDKPGEKNPCLMGTHWRLNGMD